MNKTTIKWAVVAALTGACIVGCGSIPQLYDNNEFEQLVRIETSARLMDCTNEITVADTIGRLSYDTEVLTTYVQYTPRNSEVTEMSKILNEDIKELKAQYDEGKGNPTYCNLKKKQFLTKIRKALTAIAQKRR